MVLCTNTRSTDSLLISARRKPSNKKHKTWDGDGILAVRNGVATLQDVSGRETARAKCEGPLEDDAMLSVGGKEIQVESAITKADYLATKSVRGAADAKPTLEELEEKLQTNVKFNSKLPSAATPQMAKPQPKPFTVPASQPRASQAQFKTHLYNQQIRVPSNDERPVPRHDPNQPGALVMKRPLEVPRGKKVVDVVVDPLLCGKLREHQREGVKFLYECVMGMRQHSGEGAILADEMGLGKTLQVIALLWTLLKQNPIHGEPPVVRRAVVVCPATVVKNWRKEFRKWLGERVGVFVADAENKQRKLRITDFTHGRAYTVLIIGYERLRTVQTELQKGGGVDIVIADEGHRLKTAKNKSSQAIKSLGTERRIILSGTPMQNDLTEFYFACDLVNPGVLGKASSFKSQFETPIIKYRENEGTEKDLEKGKARSAELHELTRMFFIRRTADILAQYLPPKTETILFCRPTAAQASAYKAVLQSPAFGTVFNSSETAFQLINILKKLCNSPTLLKDKRKTTLTAPSTDATIDDPDCKPAVLSTILSSLPPHLLKSPGTSTKLRVLDSLLHAIRTRTSEKVVIVSHYTSTLDMLETLLSKLSYTWLRLDGTTPTSKRQGLVDRFNRTDSTQCFAFLLSAKSGGVGVNLVGASRLVLFDVDWNPSTDQQAMARIHRDGQKRRCRIYRLLVRGALDEKIYQRQLMKRGLADAVVDNKASANAFSKEELKEIFRLDEDSACRTHELIGCTCRGSGVPPLGAPDGHQGRKKRSRSTATRDTDGFIDIDSAQLRGDASLPSDVSSSDETPDSDNESLPPLSDLVKASQLDMEKQERRITARTLSPRKRGGKKDGKPEMQALMQYLHVDVARIAGEEQGGDRGVEVEAAVDDDVLCRVLREPEIGVSYLFTRTAC